MREAVLLGGLGTELHLFGKLERSASAVTGGKGQDQRKEEEVREEEERSGKSPRSGKEARAVAFLGIKYATAERFATPVLLDPAEAYGVKGGGGGGGNVPLKRVCKSRPQREQNPIERKLKTHTDIFGTQNVWSDRRAESFGPSCMQSTQGKIK